MTYKNKCLNKIWFAIIVKHSKWTPLDIEISKENSYRSRLSKYRRDRSGKLLTKLIIFIEYTNKYSHFLRWSGQKQ